MEKLYEFENLLVRIRKLEREKVKIKGKYHRINVRIHSLKASKNLLKKEITKNGYR